MRIAILGAGYVGVVSAACLARKGHHVTLVEPVRAKVDGLERGESPIYEAGVGELIEAAHTAGRLRATTEVTEGLHGADMVWVCVGTPSGSDGSVELGAVEKAMLDIGHALSRTGDRPLVAVRSTVTPGTTAGRLVPCVENSGLSVGKDLDVVFHPEFLREGSGIADFDDPPKIVVGETTEGSGDRLVEFYADAHVPVFRLDAAEAELLKYADNVFHAVKITFANEVGALAHALDLDGRRVLDVLKSDTKLNASPAYLNPGFAFGGSCLPKDTRALQRVAELRSLRLPLLDAIPNSNSTQIDRLATRVLQYEPATVGMIGLAFKQGTDDMRESPFVKVAKRLIGEGIDVRIYDPSVHPENLIGSNKRAVQAALSHLESMLVRSPEELDNSDVILLNHSLVAVDQLKRWLASGVHVVDLAGTDEDLGDVEGYEGLAW